VRYAGRCLVAIFDDRADAEQAVRALNTEGYPEAAVRMLHGAEAPIAHQLHHPRAMTRFAWAVSGKTQVGRVCQAYRQSLREGKSNVIVPVPSAAEARHVSHVLKPYHAYSCTYFGYAFEQL